MRRFRNINELEEFYKNFEGSTLSELYQYVQDEYPHIDLTVNKGIVGQILEALIGNAPNSDPHPDVNDISVELKVLPLRKISDEIQPKERSKIKSLNYNTIIDEEWPTSTLKEKMEKILFLLYEQPTGKSYKDWEELVFRGTMYYELKNEHENIVKEDWEGIKYKVVDKRAHELSEGDSMILGACTSGTGRLVSYGENNEAKQRSFSLKHSYLKVFYKEKIKNIEFDSLNIRNEVKPHDYVLDIFNQQLSGKKLYDIVNEYEVDFSPRAKSSFRLLLNRVLNIDDKKEIKELEENGIIIKTVPVNFNNRPWEAMSFPKFSLVDLIYEEWDGSDVDEDIYEDNGSVFKEIITKGFIFVPIIKEKENNNFTNWTNWEIGNSVYWKASVEELQIIKKEWLIAKNIVENGVIIRTVSFGAGERKENNLIKSRNTKIIHMRPHARNSKDIDKPYAAYTNDSVQIAWQSFWLNKKFVEEILNN